MVFLRRTSPLDRISLAILLLYAIVRIAGSFGVALPGATFLAFFSFVAVAYFIFRILPWVRNRLLWRLRNRLIVAYIFIAVVPVVLLLTVAAIAGVGIYLQLGAHLLHDDLQERISTIAADTDALAGAIEQEAERRTPKPDESLLSRPEVASFIEAARAAWPDLLVLPNRGQELVKAGDGHRFAGLVEFENKLWIAAAVHKTRPAGPLTLFVGVPVNSALLDGLSPDLGPIQLFLLRRVAETPKDGFSFDFNGNKYVAGEQITSRRRPLAPPVNFLDVRINGATTFELVHVEAGKVEAPAAVFATFLVRPSTLNHRLVTSVGDIGPMLNLALIVVIVIFLALEIMAFATGIVLTRTITRAVGDLYEATLHIRRGDFSHRVRVHKRDQLGALGESFNEMTSSVTELIEEQRQFQKLENEVTIAREVQSQLFPQSLPSLPGLQLAAVCRPARVVSGDYYDFIRLSPSRVGIALADISGKGIFAALLMASLQAALRSTAALDQQGGTANLVSRLNDHLFKNTSDDRYATLFYAVYDSDARTLTYTNAGHLAPFFISNGQVQKLEDGGTVVGLIEDSPYAEKIIRVAPGSLLVSFSDGLTEPENVYGEEFGIARLQEEVIRQRNAAPDRLAANLIAAADQWAGTQDQADDITVVVARMG